ncbi:MAG: cation diffusion facilitator family transporter [Alphaproteobacteria bacterium]|jgi:ferrous-iron efflux pump FieF|nr:cation diffusion facilitator family transporter [Alphaproteobacteria bacterium]
MRLATYAAVSVASLLIMGKLVAWLMTDSVAILGSLMDSALDAGASLINLLAVRHALMPADREHRFGHGKAEALAGLAQAAFITGSAAFLLFEAIDRLHRPRPIAESEVGIAILVASIVVTIALVLFQAYVVRQTGSIAIKADSLHYRGDLLMNLAVILALVLSTRTGLSFLDPIFAIAIAAYIVYGAWQIFRNASDHLMDRELPDAERRRIRETAVSHPKVINMHDLRTRSSGVHTFIQLHLELDPDMPLIEAHEVSDEVEAKIRNAFAGAEVIIHQDPHGVEEERAVFRS